MRSDRWSAAFGALGLGLALAGGCTSGADTDSPRTLTAPPRGGGSEPAGVPAGEDAGGSCTGDACVSCISPGCGSGLFETDAGPGPGVLMPVMTTPLQPAFGPTVTASTPPPPISGGTLLVTRDGKMAIAADPDRDAVYGIDLGRGALAYTIALQPGDEPGRIAEDGAGRAHVALRRGGALLSIDLASGAVLSRRSACPAPRGVAWDASGDVIWVACATGELVALPSGGGAATSTLVLERDLRDVVVASDGSLAVSKFRSAEVLRVAADGSVARRDALPPATSDFVSHVAWRMVAGPSGTLVSVHQAESTLSVSTKVQGGYGPGSCGLGPPPPPPPLPAAVPTPPPVPPGFPGGCLSPESGVVASVLTVLAPDGLATLNRALAAALPVDVAVSADGSSMAAIAPGNAFVSTLSTVFFIDQGGKGQGWSQSVGSATQPVAVAFDGAKYVIVQTREPAQLWILDQATGTMKTSVTLSATSRGDTGHDIFHTQAGAMIACASCHPEGGDDGHVWILDGASRRTPSLRGTIAGTAPYHWPGDEANLSALVDDVYTHRMSGATLDAPRMGAVQSWVESIPAPPAPSWVDQGAAQRGAAIFQSAAAACSSCHSGTKLTNNETVDVGTGGRFQVPPLVGVGWRTPLLHDGCAASFGERLGACATAQHGSIGTLSTQDLSDLTAYLETL